MAFKCIFVLYGFLVNQKLSQFECAEYAPGHVIWCPRSFDLYQMSLTMPFSVMDVSNNAIHHFVRA